MSRTKREKDLEAVLRKVHKLASDLMSIGEWDLGRQAAEIGNKIDQKIQGHRSQRRKK